MDIDKFKESVIQISTPSGTGSGFYLKDYNLIVTNSHVVDGHKEVVIKAKNLKKEIARVFFDDPKYDLAFIKSPILDIDTPIKLSDKDVEVRDRVVAIGHPYGLNYTTTEGIVSKTKRLLNDIEYIQTDAAINPGNSGGPLIDMDGDIVGVNTLIIQESNNLGFSLPVRFVKEALDGYKSHEGKDVIRCTSCNAFNLESDIEDDYCPNCGKKIEVSKQRRDGYEPNEPTTILIEKIIKELGKDVKISRIGPRSWEIEEGSADIVINYFQNGTVVCDAYLCTLPKENLQKVYEYLLRENKKLDFLFLSINNNKILLSFLVLNSSLTFEYGKEVFNRLFKKSDIYDDILINDFGAMAINKDD